MSSKAIILTLTVVAMIGCQSNNEKSDSAQFVAPQLINTQFNDSIESMPYQAENVTEMFPSFVGKFKYQEKIDVNPEIRDTTVYKYFITGRSFISLTDSMDSNGFELIVDYDNSVKYNEFYDYDSTVYDHYPVYFVNSTRTAKVFHGRNHYVFGIQEAVDKEKYETWRPIEARGFDFCGNGRWGIVVNPNEFVLILMRKYDGDFETKMRVRFEVGDNIFVSRPFNGRINKSQFSIQDSSFLGQMLREADGREATDPFYGAIPKE